MAFNNPKNRCSLTGYVHTDIESSSNSNAIEFGIVVKRTSAVKGEMRVWFDKSTLYPMETKLIPY